MNELYLVMPTSTLVTRPHVHVLSNLSINLTLCEVIVGLTTDNIQVAMLPVTPG